MTRTFVELPIFQKKWKSMGLDDKDLRTTKKGVRKCEFV